jgi:hypothetical protein
MIAPGTLYYFEVGRPIAGHASYLSAADSLTQSNEDMSALKTFRTLTEAQRFYDMMRGRWAGEPLILRTHRSDAGSPKL